ncbi:glycosyltransferase [Sphingomonas sp. QA11]|uniref:glycosyltransferase n=1 Tax=Sphingomonas sp. QA11 TaxID=2950605 RepID=UPI00234B09C0|nr:glycosyltransferase [Sphingomonas sp. QA11]WCM29069.1 glycosyltransferase [Sphingomonas sp. QA11]
MTGARIVFVTFELYPLTGGGIGRAIYNMVESIPAEERENVTVVIVGDYAPPQKVPTKLRGIDVIFADINDEHGLTDGEAVFPPRWAFDATEWHWRSYVAMRALRQLSEECAIAYIEFTDWGGLGYCTIQEKKLGLAFTEVPIGIRLHGPHGVLLCTERYAVTENDLSIFDIERKALRDCDLVIAQTRPYFDKVREVFGFDPAEWESRYFYSPPPVITDFDPDVSWRSGHGQRQVLFTSKFQHVKRPEIFVRGVSEFLDSDAGNGWSAIFCARITDANSKQSVIDQIPSSLGSRFEFDGDIQGADRDALIARSVVVITSACESFCLAAFEASLLGALVILNGTNPSFAEDTLWHDGVNCIKFDGTATGLASALKHASSFDDRLTIVQLPAFAHPWRMEKPALPPREGSADDPRISVVIYGAGDATKVARTMRNIAASAHGNVELILAWSGEGDDARNLLERQIKEARSPDVRLSLSRTDKSIGASLNRAVQSCTSDYVIIVPAGALLHSMFLYRVSSAFDRDGSIDAIGCQIGFFDPDSPPAVDHAMGCIRYSIAVGEAALVGHVRNRVGDGPIAIRRDVAVSQKFDEELHADLIWSFNHCLQSRQGRIMTLNAAYAFCDIKSHDENIRNSHYVSGVLNQHQIVQTTSSQSVAEGSFWLLASLSAANSARQINETVARELPGNFDVQKRQAHLSGGGDSHAGVDTIGSRRFYNRLPRFLTRWRRKISDYDRLRHSEAFDDRWYVSQYPDVAQSGMDPLDHYLKFGGFEGRFPNPYFDSGRYILANPDVKDAGMNPLLHYVLHGRTEGRYW